MKKGGQIKKIFPEGNSARGFFAFYDSILQNLEQVYIIKGEPGTGKSTFMRRISLGMIERGYNVELLCSSSDSDSLAGVIFPEIKVGLLEGTALKFVSLQTLNVKAEIFDLNVFLDEEILSEYQKEIGSGKKKTRQYLDRAYSYLNDAKTIHDRLESFLIEAADFKSLNELAENIIGKIFNRKPQIRHFFASLISAEGYVNYMNIITEGIVNRYVIKGKLEAGKSTLMKKVEKAALERGYDLDIYHCAFDPERVDMLVIPALSTALVSGAFPHLEEPLRDTDLLVNLNEYMDFEESLQKNSIITDQQAKFNFFINQAVGELIRAKKTNDQIEGFYIEAMNFDALDSLRQTVFNKILAFADKKGTRR